MASAEASLTSDDLCVQYMDDVASFLRENAFVGNAHNLFQFPECDTALSQQMMDQLQLIISQRYEATRGDITPDIRNVIRLLVESTNAALTAFYFDQWNIDQERVIKFIKDFIQSLLSNSTSMLSELTKI